jgi:hypothetical protein
VCGRAAAAAAQPAGHRPNCCARFAAATVTYWIVHSGAGTTHGHPVLHEDPSMMDGSGAPWPQPAACVHLGDAKGGGDGKPGKERIMHPERGAASTSDGPARRRRRRSLP